MSEKTLLKRLLTGEKDVSSLKVPNLQDGLSLRDYQKIAVASFLTHNRLLLYDQVGMGKTLSSFAPYVIKKQKIPNLKFIYATVISALGQAEEEFNKFFHGFDTVSVTAQSYFHNGEKVKNFTKKYSRENFWETLAPNYDAVFLGHSLLKIDAKFIAYHLRPYILVLDEANYFKGINPLTGDCSDAHRKAKALAKKSESTWLLTADPIENSLKDAYGLMSVIRPDIFGDVNQFLKDHCKTFKIQVKKPASWKSKGTMEVPILTGFKNKELFKTKFDYAAIGRTREEVAAELPSLIVRSIFLELPRPKKKVYDQVEEGIFSGLTSYDKTRDVSETEAVALENMIRCQQILGCPTHVLSMLQNKKKDLNSRSKDLSKQRVDKLRGATKKSDKDLILDSDGDQFVVNWDSRFDFLISLLEKLDLKTTAKTEEIKRLIFDELVGQKIIIYSSYLRVIDYLEERLQGLRAPGSDKNDKTVKPLKVLRITGAEDPETKNNNRKLFTEDPDHNILLVTTAAVKALNLQAARTVICHDVPITWGKLRQLTGRVQRQGSKFSSVNLMMLMVKGTIDYEIYKKLYKTQKDVELVLGDLDKDKVVQLDESFSGKSLLNYMGNKVS